MVPLHYFSTIVPLPCLQYHYLPYQSTLHSWMQQAFQGFSHSDASDGLDLDHWTVCCGPEHCSLCLAVPPVQHSSGSTIYLCLHAEQCRMTLYMVCCTAAWARPAWQAHSMSWLHVPTKQWLCKYIKCGYVHMYLAWYAHIQCILHVWRNWLHCSVGAGRVHLHHLCCTPWPNETQTE